MSPGLILSFPEACSWLHCETDIKPVGRVFTMLYSNCCPETCCDTCGLTMGTLWLVQGFALGPGAGIKNRLQGLSLPSTPPMYAMHASSLTFHSCTPPRFINGPPPEGEGPLPRRPAEGPSQGCGRGAFSNSGVLGRRCLQCITPNA